MTADIITQTQRLTLRQLTLDDAAFQLELMNTPDWHRFIGDRQVYDLVAAKEYLAAGTLKSYKKHGFGMWLMESKEDKRPIGLCGLIKREGLEEVEIGFALSPKETGKGYALEAAKATMELAKHQFKLGKVIAITNPDNHASIKLLQNIGLEFSKTLMLDELDKVLLFKTNHSNQEQQNQIKQLEVIVKEMLTKFNNRKGETPDFDGLRKLFIQDAIIVSDSQGSPVSHDIDSFIEPRQKMLTDGTFKEFSEEALSVQTQIYGNTAQCFVLYQKSGLYNGEKYQGRGMKSIQFIKLENKWLISALAWTDESQT